MKNESETIEKKLARLGRRQKILDRLVVKAKVDLAKEILKLGPERLHSLMVKNTYGEGLSGQEFNEAETLIGGLPLGSNDCWACSFDGNKEKRKEISGLGICRGHASYALVTRK